MIFASKNVKKVHPSEPCEVCHRESSIFTHESFLRDFKVSRQLYLSSFLSKVCRFYLCQYKSILSFRFCLSGTC